MTGKADIVVLDRTGTLTMGQPEVVDLVAAPETADDQLLSTATAIKAEVDHTLAHAIERRVSGIPASKASVFANLEGVGAQPQIDGTPLFRANRRLMEARGNSAPVGVNALMLKSARLTGLRRLGGTAVPATVPAGVAR